MYIRILSLSSLLLIAGFINASQTFDRKKFLNQKLSSLSERHSEAHKIWRKAHNDMIQNGKTKEGNLHQNLLIDNKDQKAISKSYIAFLQTKEYREQVAPLWVESYHHWFLYVDIQSLLNGKSSDQIIEKQKWHLNLIKSNDSGDSYVLAQANLAAAKDFNELIQELEQAETTVANYNKAAADYNKLMEQQK